MADTKELTKQEKTIAMVAFAMGLACPEEKELWSIEGIDNDSLTKEEEEFIIKIRKDQWSTSLASILSILDRRDLINKEQMEGFKYSVARGLKASEEKRNGK